MHSYVKYLDLSTRAEGRAMLLLGLALEGDTAVGGGRERRAATLMACAASLRERADQLRSASPEVPVDRYAEARAFVVGSGRATISFVQRALRMGFNETATYIERMEQEGIVSAPGDSGVRAVLAKALRPQDVTPSASVTGVGLPPIQVF